ncbi:MAG TPA: hypothetical protein PLD62_04610 [Candidatus Cloacimonadota bacterium]|nr:hypothetical protein [Candidatus Cloacimonadota bacterium]
MGRLLIIFILLVTITFMVITLSLKDRRSAVAEDTAENLAELQAKALSNEALNYGIKKMYDGSLNYQNNHASLVFDNFSVLDGKIDSINYVKNAAGDSTVITTYATYLANGAEIHRNTEALVYLVPANIQAAVSANGDVIIKGNAAVVGDIDENVNPPLDFEKIFGVTKAYVKSIANHYYTDPPNNQTPCEDITWVDITGSGSFKVSTTGWYGSGLTVIDGDADFSGGNFYGVLWITGELRITGNLIVDGALFVEGGTEIAATVISGSPVIEFSVEAVSDFLGSVNFPTEMEHRIVGIFNE